MYHRLGYSIAFIRTLPAVDPPGWQLLIEAGDTLDQDDPRADDWPEILILRTLTGSLAPVWRTVVAHDRLSVAALAEPNAANSVMFEGPLAAHVALKRDYARRGDDPLAVDLAGGRTVRIPGPDDVDLGLQRHTLRQVAAQLGVNPSVISRRARRLGLGLDTGSVRLFTREDVEALRPTGRGPSPSK